MRYSYATAFGSFLAAGVFTIWPVKPSISAGVVDFMLAVGCLAMTARGRA